MARLILLVGLPGSGKSYLSRQLAGDRSELVVSTDAIRAQLFGDAAVQGPWGEIRKQIEVQLSAARAQIEGDRHQFALYDATNAKRSQRREAIALARQVGFETLVGIWVDTPLAVCLARNRTRHRHVPEEVILRMQRQLSDAPPSLAEGFDDLIRYTGSR